MKLSLFEVSIAIFLLVFIAFLLLFILKRHAAGKKESFQTSFPFPPENKDGWQKHVGELILLGFRFRESFNKMLYGLWNSTVDLYTHEVFDAYAELAYFPSGKIQLQFVTLFPNGSITTMVGEKILTVNLYSSHDQFSWETGNLIAIWETHMRKVDLHQEQSGEKPISAQTEAYHDFVNLFKTHLHTRLASVEFQPKTVDDFLVLGFAYLDVFNEEKSLAMLDGALVIESVNPYLYQLAGKAAMYFSNLPKAQSFFQKAFEFNPKDRESAFLLVNIFLQTRQENQAFEYLKKIRERFPNEPNVTLQLGLVCLNTGRLIEAQAYLEEINDASMASSTLFNALSVLYGKFGDGKQAKKYRRLARVFNLRKNYWEELKWMEDLRSRRR